MDEVSRVQLVFVTGSERGSHSTVHHLLSGTQSFSLEAEQTDDAFAANLARHRLSDCRIYDFC